ncbi:bifunctional glycosyltransferase/CDP-glycerol:glycerophosphate glycerophosphotransferase [Actinacidiphila glaucinigra]|uniref:CDP-glycerol glycerophosphotransferase n=1 Tax=Actinacidiphila glaucinigra TaxID=235986 RepID=A0A239NJ72_9ACTN|nr:CDP-glycerol glycerophosphotransferase family protein [Actinacidiphila glaucinigra]SNT54454.1 CDP-glycerol glycerophosphotransferase [Actinacidiphila glaucinigra]
MPRFSVIVPVWKAQGYVRACLESVLGQRYADLELIAVDDCSPDGSAAVVEEVAAADPRVLPLRQPRNAGAGPARNAGAARASGDYLLFLDADDLLAPGALAALDARLRSTGDPEVLLFDHDRLDVWEHRTESGDGPFLHAAALAGHAVFRATERPECLTVLPAAWNRVVRRDYWAGFGFGAGPYEDVPVAYEMLLAAPRIACLDRVCVTWRRRRHGSFSSTPGPQHLALADRYDTLLARHDLPVLRAERDRRLTAVLDDPGRLRPQDRAAFFRRAGLPGTFAAHRAAEMRAHAARRLRARRNAAAREVYRRWYALERRRPLDDDLVVYAAYWNRGVLCSPAAIYRKARELAPHLHGVWVVRRGERDAVPEGVDRVEVNSRRYWELLARARFLVNNANFTGEVVKRPGQVYLQTHHGTPLKHMGMDLRAHPAVAKGMSFRRLLDHADQWDYSLSANPHSSEVWERVYPGGYLTLPTGYPRNDAYFTAGAEDVRRIRARLGIPDGVRAILYAPTHRDYQREFVPQLDLARLCRALGREYLVLVRAHYFHSGAGPAALPEGALDVSAHTPLEELCLASDALLTDYSSLMFDYAGLDRPIVVHSADWEVYRAARGVYFDLVSGRPGDTPGVVARDEAAIATAFRSGAWSSPGAAELRAAFRARFCPWDDGRAAERVVRRVLLGEPELLPVLKADERTPAPPPG